MKARAFSSFLRDLSRVGQAFESDDAADLLRELAAKLDALKGNPTVTSATRQLASADAGSLSYDGAETRRLIHILHNIEKLLIVAGKKSYVTDVATLRALLETRPGSAGTDLLAQVPPLTKPARLSGECSPSA